MILVKITENYKYSMLYISNIMLEKINNKLLKTNKKLLLANIKGGKK